MSSCKLCDAECASDEYCKNCTSTKVLHSYNAKPHRPAIYGEVRRQHLIGIELEVVHSSTLSEQVSIDQLVSEIWEAWVREKKRPLPFYMKYDGSFCEGRGIELAFNPMTLDKVREIIPEVCEFLIGNRLCDGMFHTEQAGAGLHAHFSPPLRIHAGDVIQCLADCLVRYGRRTAYECVRYASFQPDYSMYDKYKAVRETDITTEYRYMQSRIDGEHIVTNIELLDWLHRFLLGESAYGCTDSASTMEAIENRSDELQAPLNRILMDTKSLHSKAVLLLMRRLIEDAEEDEALAKFTGGFYAFAVSGGHMVDYGLQRLKKLVADPDSWEELAPPEAPVKRKKFKKRKREYSVGTDASTISPDDFAEFYGTAIDPDAVASGRGVPLSRALRWDQSVYLDTTPAVDSITTSVRSYCPECGNRTAVLHAHILDDGSTVWYYACSRCLWTSVTSGSATDSTGLLDQRNACSSEIESMRDYTSRCVRCGFIGAEIRRHCSDVPTVHFRMSCTNCGYNSLYYEGQRRLLRAHSAYLLSLSADTFQVADRELLGNMAPTGGCDSP